MRMSLVVDGLRSDVVAVGELGDETVAVVAERIADVLGRSVPGRILDLLSDAAAELTATLPGGRVDIRVAGDDVEMTYVEAEPGPSAAPTNDGDAQSARISLRLGEGLKSRLEEGAASGGVSVNTFIVHMLERGLSDSRSRSRGNRVGNRLHGYGTT
jgi:HicB family